MVGELAKKIDEAPDEGAVAAALAGLGCSPAVAESTAKRMASVEASKSLDVEEELKQVERLERELKVKERVKEIPPPPCPVAEAVRQKLLELAGEPLTLKSSRKIAAFSTTATAMLQTLGRGPLPKGKRIYGGGFMGLDPLDEYPAVPMPNPLGLGGTSAETTGARLMRELIAIVPDIAAKFRPEQTVRAILAARDAGMKDIEAELRERLLDQATPAPKPDVSKLRPELDPQPQPQPTTETGEVP